MTLSFRHSLLNLLLVLSSLIGVAVLVMAGLVWFESGGELVLQVQSQALFWFWSTSQKEVTLWRVLVDTLPLLALGLTTLAWLRRQYRKTTSPTVFFLAVFGFTFVAEALRFGQVFLLTQDLPFFYSILLSRLVLAFRLLGLLCLFFASLYAFPFSYQKYGTVLGASWFVSLLLAFNLPLRTSMLQSDLLYAPGDERVLFFVFLLFGLMTIANTVLGPLSQNRKAGPWLPLVMFLLYGAWNALFFGSLWALAFVVPALVLLQREYRDASLVL